MAELRILCRDQISLIEQRTALVLQLKAALHEYYPIALEAFDDWTRQFAWEFVLQFPDPIRLLGASKHKWEKFLHAHKLYRPETAQMPGTFRQGQRVCQPQPGGDQSKEHAGKGSGQEPVHAGRSTGDVSQTNR